MSEILVKEYRGNIVENAHRGSIAVVSSTGDTIAYLGDIEKQTFMRSASKPIQVLPTLLAGLHRRFNLTDEDVAMFNSSHWGSNHHIFVLEEISTPVSMAFRHFGNILSGTVISTLLYWALASLSHVIFGWLPGFLSQIQLFQIGIPAFTGLYFDWFGGCIQAFIFCTLTTIFIKRAAGED